MLNVHPAKSKRVPRWNSHGNSYRIGHWKKRLIFTKRFFVAYLAFLQLWKARMQTPATFRPPDFMHLDNFTLHTSGAALAAAAAPRSLPEDLRLGFLVVMGQVYRGFGAKCNFDGTIGNRYY